MYLYLRCKNKSFAENRKIFRACTGYNVKKLRLKNK